MQKMGLSIENFFGFVTMYQCQFIDNKTDGVKLVNVDYDPKIHEEDSLIHE